MTRRILSATFLLSLVPAGCAPAPGPGPGPLPPGGAIMWINHLDLLPGDPSVTTSFNAVQSGGLVIRSTTTGDQAPGGGNKVVERALEVPPGYRIRAVRVCYQSSSAGSFISQIRLAQIQDPPPTAVVQLDDGTDLTNPGPICVNSAATDVNPGAGAVRLNLRLNFASTSDRITVHALGLQLVPM